MRRGLNPNKDKLLETSEFFHQVVIPLYIPNQKNYFRESLDIFKRSLESLFKTCHSQTFFTIVNNGSSDEVKIYLEELFSDGKIQEVIHTTGIGKLNSIIKGISGHQFPYITIADADVLFLNGWQKSTYQVFVNFPKSGVVGLTPQFKQFEHKCGHPLFENLFSEKMKFTDVQDEFALKHFYRSLGWKDDYNPDFLKKNLTISSGNCRAIIGNGHYVATYKGGLFTDIPKYFNVKMGSGSEGFLDNIPLLYGMWRLTTEKNYAYHMGNILEGWMEEEILNLRLEKISEVESPEFPNHGRLKKISGLENFIINKAFMKIFKIPLMRKMFYRYKGLPGKMVKSF